MAHPHRRVSAWLVENRSTSKEGQGSTALAPSVTNAAPRWRLRSYMGPRSDEIVFGHGASLLVAAGVVAAGVVAARVARSRRSLIDWLVARHRVRGAHVDCGVEILNRELTVAVAVTL